MLKGWGVRVFGRSVYAARSISGAVQRRGGTLLGRRRSILALFFAAALVGRLVSANDTDFNPPASYYNAATGTGATLKGQLLTIMSTGQLSRTYGDFRFSAAITDVDPNNPNNVLLVYNRASVLATWDPNPTALWNREHIWPQALQPGGDVSNSTTGHKADAFALRPANPSINTSRGDKPFGFDTTTGSYGAVANGYYFPGDADKGDVARSLFYSDTRYGPSLGISLTDNVPTTNQMGDLSSLIAWHYLDPPDAFERRRNQAIYSQTMNPTYYAANRNAYIDHPEYVWSIYMNQANDSRLTIASPTTVSPDGSATTKTVDLGRVLVGGSVPAAQSFTLSKSGYNGTYFEISTGLNGYTPTVGRFNAFPITTNPTDSRSITVGLNPSTSTATAGVRTGTVTIDNLDITSGGCASVGCGANDGNDTFNVSLNVLDHMTPSFTSPSLLTTRTLDFGNVALGSSSPTLNFDVFDLNGVVGSTANMDFDSVTPSGSTSAFTTNLGASVGLLQIAAGSSQSFSASMNATSVGSFLATYTLNFSDENLAGAQNKSLTLTLTGIVRLAGDYNGDGIVNAGDYTVWRNTFGQTVAAYSGADGDGNTQINDADFDVWRAHFGQMAAGSGSGSLAASAAVPEPGSLYLFVAALTALVVQSAPVVRRGRDRRRSH